jgi:O-antigen chain-terminating methyltransferase
MNTIQALVDDLPELYQPIFGHPELSQGSSRSSNDRLVHIVDIYKAVEAILGRPLNVLDLGCAQGFFSLNLAALGATVHGVDYLEKNIHVCHGLLAENPEFKAQFTFGKVEELLQTVESGQYDLVLGLSVFHHLVYDFGKEQIKQTLDLLLHKITVFIGEFALTEEPLYWGPAQPEDPRYLLSNSAFLHELSRHPTHLADIERPLYVASNQIWYLDGMAERINSWTPESHALAAGAHQGARRYYFSDNYFVKVFRLEGQFGPRNKAELVREGQFLKNPPAGYSVPRYYLSGCNDVESWLVTERIEGELLLDALTSSKLLDKRKILLNVLEQLAFLEHHGFYHDDIRVWNVMLDADLNAHLIDYGSISSEPTDCVWPHNIYLSFLIFVKEVVVGFIDNPSPLREITISPYSLPQPYASWVNSFWKKPVSTWSFQMMYDSLEESGDRYSIPMEDTSSVLWMRSIESALQALKKHVHHVENNVGQSRNSFEERFKALDHKSDLLAGSRIAQQQLEESLSNSESWRLKAERLEIELNATANLLIEAENEANALRVQIGEYDLALAECSKELASAKLNFELIETASRQNSASELQVRDQQLVELQDSHAALARQLLESQQSYRQLEEQLGECQSNTHHWYLRAIHGEQRVDDLLSSTSWRLTKPLRIATVQAGRLVRLPLKMVKSPLRKGALMMINGVANRPGIKRRVAKLLSRYPHLNAHLRQFARNQGALGRGPAGAKNMQFVDGSLPAMFQTYAEGDPHNEALSSRGREVFKKFEKVIKTKDVL